MADPKMTDAQRAYEQKRAAKAGKSLDSWLAQKRRQASDAKPTPIASPAKLKPPGLIRRLLDRAHKPL